MNILKSSSIVLVAAIAICEAFIKEEVMVK